MTKIQLKLFIVSLFVCSVFAVNDFIGNSKRAEIFELTDNEVAIFRVTLPDEEFAQLKDEVQSGTGLPPPPEFDENGNILPPPGFEIGSNGLPPSPFGSEDDFKTKNATMIVEVNNEEKSFDKVTFSLGGSSSRTFCKQGFNIKIRNKNKDLYGRKQFRIRPDAREATFLRSKLTCDIHNRLGLPSISANYITLYINEEFMGLYVLMDSFKVTWAELEYGDKDTTTLYQCKNMRSLLNFETSSTGCVNENDDVTDHSEWNELLSRLDAAESAEDIEDIFDVDQFLYEMAFEYLSGSWDHYLKFGHNFNLYRPKGDKWKFLLYDFDAEFGQDINIGSGPAPGQPRTTPKNTSTDYPTYTFEEWAQPRHLVDILILKDSTRFDNILRKFVTDAFNPNVLFPHIDEIKEFIRPYVELDKTPDENGKYPGRWNENIGDYSLAQWDANSEFTNIRSVQGGSFSYGLKYWILAKYRYVCKAYNIECDPDYLDESYEFPIDKDVEATSIPTQGALPPVITIIGVNDPNTIIDDEPTGNDYDEEETSTEAPTAVVNVDEPTTYDIDEEVTDADEPTIVDIDDEPTSIYAECGPTTYDIDEEKTDADEPTSTVVDDEPTGNETDEEETASVEPVTIVVDPTTTTDVEPTTITTTVVKSTTITRTSTRRRKHTFKKHGKSHKKSKKTKKPKFTRKPKNNKKPKIIKHKSKKNHSNRHNNNRHHHY